MLYKNSAVDSPFGIFGAPDITTLRTVEMRGSPLCAPSQLSTESWVCAAWFEWRIVQCSQWLAELPVPTLRKYSTVLKWRRRALKQGGSGVPCQTHPACPGSPGGREWGWGVWGVGAVGAEVSLRQRNGLPTSMSKLAKMGKEAYFTSVLWNRPSIGQSGSYCPISSLPKFAFID